MAEFAPNTPVLVGVAAIQQKLERFEDAREAVTLMERALTAAATDAMPDADSAEALLRRADEILVPKGLWKYSDPARLLSVALGATSATTVLGEIGVLQQTLMTRACQRIRDGEIKIALVAGAEAKYRSLCALKSGGAAVDTVQEDVEADTVLHPDSEMWSTVESATGLGMPVGFYAIIDSALRHKQGLSVDAHRDQMAEMYARFSEIAAQNPDAWADQTVASEFIRESSSKNRMLAFPYAKLHNSQWNVDQAAGLVFCSVQVAREMNIPREKWIFPRASTESNFMSVVAARKDLGGSAGFRIAGEVAMEMASVSFDDIRLRELYSCFPSAIRVQLEEFGMRGEGDFSVTGAMTFGGGPLNNFVLQATVKMAQLLRRQPAEVGLVTSVSGMLTKQACALWSATPNPGGWEFADVTERVRSEIALCEIVPDYAGPGTVAGYTVLYQGETPWRAVAVFDLPGDKRFVAYSENVDIVSRMLARECCGDRFSIHSGQFFL
ncbi:MAG: acetyl-CoA C-acetyltransferase [Halioglobus sp.]|jgi:acetyl-CoA C-acetyltransferase